VVRNPLDCIASLFNMIGTGTHSQSIAEDELNEMQQNGVWEDFVA
jgi:hypothetical protein